MIIIKVLLEFLNIPKWIFHNSLPNLDISEGADFYGARQEKIEKLLNSASRELSEEQKAYWQNMNNKVEEPLEYGYYEGWEIIIISFEHQGYRTLSLHHLML